MCPETRPWNCGNSRAPATGMSVTENPLDPGEGETSSSVLARPDMSGAFWDLGPGPAACAQCAGTRRRSPSANARRDLLAELLDGLVDHLLMAAPAPVGMHGRRFASLHDQWLEALRSGDDRMNGEPAATASRSLEPWSPDRTTFWAIPKIRSARSRFPAKLPLSDGAWADSPSGKASRPSWTA